MSASGPDPFGTAAIRHGVLEAWRLSSTRIAEDAAAEAELVHIGYRDRLFTELAANAADAAPDTGGHLAIWCSGQALHVANTGAPLTAAGVSSLAALRASSKADRGTVGRFGVGFTAVSAVADEVAIRSTSGGVVFSRRRTREALVANEIPVPDEIPLRRLPWPDDTAPADGFDTDVVLSLRPGIDGETLLAEVSAIVGELLLELTALTAITVHGHRSERAIAARDGHELVGVGSQNWVQTTGEHARWLMPGTPDHPMPLHDSLLRAPTRTDVALTLPALCIADVSLTPDRRGLHPDADIATAAIGYHRLARALHPARRLAAVPRPGFAASPVDDRLRTAVLADLTEGAWIPCVDGADVRPGRAVAIVDIDDALAAVLGEVIDGLVIPDLCSRSQIRALRAVGVQEVTLAQLCDRLTGVLREPRWWAQLYEALTPMVPDDHAVAEIATIPVPRAEGRMAMGARGLVLAQLGRDHTVPQPISWLPMVHPDAEHPLVERLGARPMSVTEMLADPALRASLDDVDPEAVIGLVAADPDADTPSWLGGLLLPDTDGGYRPADELLIADGPLAQVLIEDHPFGFVAPEVVRRHGAQVLARVGVGVGFTVLVDEFPVGPDHDLADEEQWWQWLSDEPQRLVAVRDLDLVDPQRWSAALTMLVADPRAAATLADRAGYTAWWLRTYAELDGHRLGCLRSPDDDALAGVVDVVDHPDAAAFAAALAGTQVESIAQASIMLANLGDPDRDVAPGVAAGAHAALVTAYRRGVFDLADLDPPVGVRTVSGAVAETALVCDAPWIAQVLPSADLVVAGVPVEASSARDLADILDIPSATDELDCEVVSSGAAVSANDSAAAVLDAIDRGVATGAGLVRVHDRLEVSVTRAGVTTVHRVRWWVDSAGVRHLGGEFER
ncbi:sacsin N-terminal ATP-binding-like domain-containing protein [Williamsia sp. CHRR-6]|uniref:sacsin N-terminal ATP-binding-like domain-containing protein n=1 Tax=Williamsia sp. CHRR-6 TaxID=2835871 RepID=UPI001BDAF63B|nr:hypothetical protein [Williamsia sp. CHRR-6]MBT0566407.1 hypothetical protein [Williamsia sp. CHRR-6]